jgi:uncharacterized membrane protein SirB2
MMIEYYNHIKIAHQLFVFISLSVFIARSVLMLSGNYAYKHILFKKLTPINDSLLLTLGVMLIIVHPANLMGLAWFQHKMIFLVIYVVFGTLAINHLEKYPLRVLLLFLALICASSMLYMAYTKSSIILLCSKYLMIMD